MERIAGRAGPFTPPGLQIILAKYVQGEVEENLLELLDSDARLAQLPQ
jgi:hypothetical protein